jgi:hypothetical protein
MLMNNRLFTVYVLCSFQPPADCKIDNSCGVITECKKTRVIKACPVSLVGHKSLMYNKTCSKILTDALCNYFWKTYAVRCDGCVAGMFCVYHPHNWEPGNLFFKQGAFDHAHFRPHHLNSYQVT